MTWMARRRIWLAGLLAMLAVVAALAASSRRAPPVAVPRLEGATITVVPGIHLLGGLGPSAAYAVECGDGLILIDTGLDEDAHLLKAELNRLNLDWKRVHSIFLTHVHGDHSGGAQYLRSQTKARVHAGQGDAPALREGSSRDLFFATYDMPYHSPHPTTVDVELAADEIFQFGDVRLQALSTPGHSPGSVCYLVERDGLRVLFSGDVIMRLGERPLGTYTVYLEPRYGGNAQAYLATLHKLKALPVPDLLLPGHPRSSRTPQNPRLTAAHWRGMLNDGIREMQRHLARAETVETDEDGGTDP